MVPKSGKACPQFSYSIHGTGFLILRTSIGPNENVIGATDCTSMNSRPRAVAVSSCTPAPCSSCIVTAQVLLSTTPLTIVPFWPSVVTMAARQRSYYGYYIVVKLHTSITMATRQQLYYGHISYHYIGKGLYEPPSPDSVEPVLSMSVQACKEYLYTENLVN